MNAAPPSPVGVQPSGAWARLRGFLAPPSRPRPYQSRLDAVVVEEARKSTHVLLPFLIPGIYILRLILGDALEYPGVRRSVGFLIAFICLRFCALVAMTRVSFLARSDERTRARVQVLVLTASAWLVGAGFALVYLEAAPALDASRIVKLTMLSTAICALATLSMSALLPAFVGYFGTQLGATIVLLVEHPDPDLGWRMPAMVVVLMLALAIIGLRIRAMIHEKILLALRLQDSALHDELTGLHNRHFLTEFLGQASTQLLGEWRAAMGRRRVEEKRSFALFLVDLDHFKAVNDTFGHAAGDRVLEAFAAVARATMRASDIVARWGGEEFLIVVETRDREAVLRIGERLREAFAAHGALVANDAVLPVTCSVGACLFPFDEGHPDELTWEETLVLADCTLYEAKRAGRNRCLWVRPGTANALPREMLTAVRETSGRAVRDHIVEIVGPPGMPGTPDTRDDDARTSRSLPGPSRYGQAV
jgi:diguanylate cyclase (GGDEF)-like protein